MPGPGRPFDGSTPGPGRPKGSKSKTTKAREMLETRADELIAKAIELALDGNVAMLRACLDRLLPAYKDSAAPIELPGYEFVNDPASRARAVADAVCTGKIGPEAGRDLIMALQGQLVIEKSGEEREALNELLQRAGLPVLDAKPTDAEVG